MLRHAARRAVTRREIEWHSSLIHLPWLCPALLRYTSSITSKKLQSPHAIPRTSSQIASKPSNARSLASAATASPETEDHYIPFDLSVHSNPPRIFRPLDTPLFTSNPLILDAHDVGEASRSLHRRNCGKIDKREIGGNKNELQATFEACLQVGQYTRARSLANRLGELHPPKAPEMVTICNQYLRRVTSDLSSKQRNTVMDLVEGWIENDMKKARVEADSTTYALMLKAALHGLSGSKRDRTIKRYWNMVLELELESEVASLHNILTDYDLGTISEICPMEFDTQDMNAYSSEALEENEYEETQRAQNSQPPKTKSEGIDIREVDQKGEGMKALKKSLSMFSSHSNTISNLDDDVDLADRDEQRQMERQLRLEKDAIDSAIERWRNEHETLQKFHVATDAQIKSLSSHLFQWQQTLAQRLREELALCDAADAHPELSTPVEHARREYGPFLRLVSPDQLAALTILTVFQRFSRAGSTQPMRLGNTVVAVSTAVEAEAVAEILTKSLKDMYGGRAKDALIAKSINRLSKIGLLTRARVNVDKLTKLWQTNSRQYPTLQLQPWPTSIHAKVGAALCSHLFEAANIKVYKEDPKTGKQLSNIQPVFQRMIKYEKGKRRAYIAVHPIMVEKLIAEPPSNLIAKQVPMVAKPRPWKSFHEGGYLTSSPGFLRIKNGESSQRKYAEAAMERGDLQGYFDGLNVLGETGWKVNGDVFRVMREAWNTGEKIANIAPENPQIELPPRPVENDIMKFRIWSHEVARLENERSGLHSERCFQNFQLEIAKTFLNETFYIPHNIDFRGRAYPIPPYFHQMGADHCRGLLLFGEGKELGETGLRWLKIHLANVYGYDKASLSEREAFANGHIEDIKDSTENPLAGKRWWLEAEDPWQCLATAFELRKALESPEPTKYVSHMPIHQDGSCNGLQHYAALGGDVEGAQQVNLEPGDRPSDVYTGVAELVKAQIEQDLERGVENAKLLQGKITRKIVKQTVMTNVYGVTFLGAMRQVRKRIEELFPELHTRSIVLSSYIAKKIFHALGTLFSGAHDIQYWLGDCANRINSSLTPNQLDRMSQLYGFDDDKGPNAKKLSAKEAASLKNIPFRCSVTWTTPLKLPVIQPYRDAKFKHVPTRLQTVTIAAPTLSDNVNKRKQLQAFPPNFIHSLDATHMMLSAVKCREMGMTFSAVHDSFWTHAADVDRMNKALRTEFIRMHSEDVIGRLAAEFKARFGNNLYRATIPNSTELAKKITEWKADQAGARGLNQRDSEFKLVEVLTEHKRQTLLRSTDPEQRKIGEAMVTPASIFEAEGQGDNSLSITNSLGATAIGHVPEVTSTKTLKTALTNAQDSSETVDVEQSILPGAGAQVEHLNDELLRDLKKTINQAADSATSAMKDREAQKEKRKKKTATTNTVSIWLPLQFPDVPKRGSWDVGRLRNSEYFFS